MQVHIHGAVEVGVKLGQYVVPGTQLMAVVPSQVWVIANFKERQTARMATGQPATLQTVADSRRTTGMFGAGYLEMLARQMTEELQRTRDAIKLGETREPAVAQGCFLAGNAS